MSIEVEVVNPRRHLFGRQKPVVVTVDENGARWSKRIEPGQTHVVLIHDKSDRGEQYEEADQRGALRTGGNGELPRGRSPGRLRLSSWRYRSFSGLR
jgi:hypothetical protein